MCGIHLFTHFTYLNMFHAGGGNLERFYWIDNGVTELLPEQFVHLSNLTKLDISYNPLTSVNSSHFQGKLCTVVPRIFFGLNPCYTQAYLV